MLLSLVIHPPSWCGPPSRRGCPDQGRGQSPRKGCGSTYNFSAGTLVKILPPSLVDAHRPRAACGGQWRSVSPLAPTRTRKMRLNVVRSGEKTRQNFLSRVLSRSSQFGDQEDERGGVVCANMRWPRGEMQPITSRGAHSPPLVLYTHFRQHRAARSLSILLSAAAAISGT